MNLKLNPSRARRRGSWAAILLLIVASTPVHAPAALADCEAQPAAAKWCPATSIPWGFGQGLTGSLTGAALTIKLTITQAMSDLNFVFAKSEVPVGLSGPGGSGILFTYGKTALGVSNCSTSRTYAKTYTNFSFGAGDAIGSMNSANIDFNNQFSGWTSALALTVTYHEMGHALGLDHVYNVSPGSCPSGVGSIPLMSEEVPCTAALGPDALFEKGIRCLYGPDGVSLHGVSFRVVSGGRARTERSRCSSQPNCSSLTALGLMTYDLAVSEDGGPYEPFATLEEADWVENGFEYTFPRAYTKARVRMQVRDGGTVIAAPISDPVDIPAPPVAVEPLAGLALRLSASPNPFHGRVRVVLEMAQAGPASVVVSNVAGRRVARLHAGTLPAGSHAFSWDGLDDRGGSAPSGVYYVEARVGAQRVSRAVLHLP